MTAHELWKLSERPCVASARALFLFRAAGGSRGFCPTDRKAATVTQIPQSAPAVGVERPRRTDALRVVGGPGLARPPKESEAQPREQSR